MRQLTKQSIHDRTLVSLHLEEQGKDVYRADPGDGGQRLFGGLVAAQAVMAAGRTVSAGRKLHSLHAYFLRPGAHGAWIDLAVARIRDGGSFSIRRVTARQRGETILEMTASFALDEAAFSQQAVEMPEVPGPAGLEDRERLRSERYREVLGIDQRPYETAVEVRLCDPSVVEPGRSSEPVQSNWLRVTGDLPDDPLLQRAFLVYASDRTLLSTARLPYDVGRHQLMSVSLDHAVWIHRDVSMSDWHLCQCFGPVSENGRSILLCHLYRQDGACVATVAQEGLVRVRRDRKDAT